MWGGGVARSPIGPRACYDEGKRLVETIMYAYAKQVCMCMCAHVCAYVYVCMCMCVHVWVCVCVCIIYQNVEVRVARIFNTFGPKMHA